MLFHCPLFVLVVLFFFFFYYENINGYKVFCLSYSVFPWEELDKGLG